MRLAAVSTKYVEIPVTDWPAGTDPTALPVGIAFTTPDETPEPSSALTASWKPGGPFTVNGKPTQYARILVGPLNGGVVLARGEYKAWVRITSAQEVPFDPAPGRVVVE